LIEHGMTVERWQMLGSPSLPSCIRVIKWSTLIRDKAISRNDLELKSQFNFCLLQGYLVQKNKKSQIWPCADSKRPNLLTWKKKKGPKLHFLQKFVKITRFKVRNQLNIYEFRSAQIFSKQNIKYAISFSSKNAQMVK